MSLVAASVLCSLSLLPGTRLAVERSNSAMGGLSTLRIPSVPAAVTGSAAAVTTFPLAALAGGIADENPPFDPIGAVVNLG
eukprot:3522230-Prymnesium_polylepis.2